jgi:glycosyltransferase involved in cell wall biosynthesis
MWTHGFRRWESAMKAKVRLSFYALADCLLVYGHRAKEILRGYGYPERRVRVVYNSMDYQKQALLRQSIDARSIDDYRVRLFGDARAAYFVYVGRVTRRKRIDILIDAFSEAYRRNDQLGLVIIGEGSELDEVRQAAHASIAADRIRFTGACYDESELALAIMGAVAVVTPGAVGLNCMHAMAYGTPVITSGDCDEHGPEVEAVVPGVTGELVEPGTVSEFARAMLSWSEKMKIREAVSDNCVAEIERAYTPKVQARLIAGACTST